MVGCSEGMAYFPCGFLWWRLWIYSGFDPFFSLFGIWAIPGDVPFVFSMKEAILSSLFLVLVPAPISALTVCSAFGLLLVRVT